MIDGLPWQVCCKAVLAPDLKAWCLIEDASKGHACLHLNVPGVQSHQRADRLCITDGQQGL